MVDTPQPVQTWLVEKEIEIDKIYIKVSKRYLTVLQLLWKELTRCGANVES